MIHSSAIIENGAKIGKNASIGAFSIVRSNVEIGDNCVVQSHCVLGETGRLSDAAPLLIGDSALVRSHSILYSGSEIGRGLQTGHHVTIREKSKIGQDFQIGTLGDVQGHCEIGDYVKAHSNVHISNGTTIGNFVWIYPGVVFTNDPNPPSEQLMGSTIEDYVVIAVKATLLPGVKIGKGSLIGAHALVNNDFGDFSVVIGNPARRLGDVRDLRLRSNSKQAAYPWPKHFSRGYPSDLIQRWANAEDVYDVSP